MKSASNFENAEVRLEAVKAEIEERMRAMKA